MKKAAIIIVLVLAAAAAGIGLSRLFNSSSAEPVQTLLPGGDVANLQELSIVPGETISGAQVITGVLTGAYFFEANARGALLDADKNVLREFPVTATTDWMTSGPVSFTLTADVTGLPAGEGYLRIANDNPSGDPALDKHMDIPVRFQ